MTAPNSTANPGGAPSARTRRSPLTGQVLEPVRPSSDSEIAEAVAKSRGAQPQWGAMALKERIATLERAAREMLERRSQILNLVREEAGKLDVDALFTEALGPLDAVKGWSPIASQWSRRSVGLNPISFPKKSAEVRMVPRGVVGVIAPWNYPVAGLYRSIIPALMFGNGVVLKPSEYTPMSSAWFIEQLARHLPDGLAQVVQGDGRVGAQLIDSGIDSCVFTGSTAAGRKVRVQCAKNEIPCSAEMGGNDPAIVLADCDLDRTVAGITHWSLHNAGQACGAVELVYVQDEIADEFVSRLEHAWRNLRFSDGEFAQADVSPLTTPAQLQLVERHIANALSKGAELVCGGQKGERGLFYAPTLLDRCDPSMDVVKDETFGPVLAIVRVPGASEAIRMTNESRYGLGASIWTGDIARGRRLAERLSVGVVNINNHAMTGAIPSLPWSGVRDTGFGIANSEFSLTTYCRPQVLLVDRNRAPEPFWMPFDPTTWELGDILADLQIGKLGRAIKLPLILRRRAKRIREFFAGAS